MTLVFVLFVMLFVVFFLFLLDPLLVAGRREPVRLPAPANGDSREQDPQAQPRA